MKVFGETCSSETVGEQGADAKFEQKSQQQPQQQLQQPQTSQRVRIYISIPVASDDLKVEVVTSFDPQRPIECKMANVDRYLRWCVVEPPAATADSSQRKPWFTVTITCNQSQATTMRIQPGARCAFVAVREGGWWEQIKSLVSAAWTGWHQASSREPAIRHILCTSATVAEACALIRDIYHAAVLPHAIDRDLEHNFLFPRVGCIRDILFGVFFLLNSSQCLDVLPFARAVLKAMSAGAFELRTQIGSPQIALNVAGALVKQVQMHVTREDETGCC